MILTPILCHSFTMLWIHHTFFHREHLPSKIHIICPALHKLNIRFPFRTHRLQSRTKLKGPSRCGSEKGSEDEIGAGAYDERLIFGREALGEDIACTPIVSGRGFLAQSSVNMPAQPEPRIIMRSRSPFSASRASRPTVALIRNDWEKQRVDASDL